MTIRITRRRIGNGIRLTVWDGRMKSVAAAANAAADAGLHHLSGNDGGMFRSWQCRLHNSRSR